MEATTVRLPEETMASIREAVRETERREDVPTMSQSELLREALTTGLEQTDLLDLLPEHKRVAYQRERIKEKNRLRDWRAGFETRVQRQLRRRFKNGYTPEGLQQFAIGMKEEARVLWPDDPETLDEKLEYVDAAVEQAREDYEVSEHDPLDIGSMYQFSGVEEGRERERTKAQREQIEEQAEKMAATASDPDPAAMADALANRYTISDELAAEIVRYVLDDEEEDDAAE